MILHSGHNFTEYLQFTYLQNFSDTNGFCFSIVLCGFLLMHNTGCGRKFYIPCIYTKFLLFLYFGMMMYFTSMPYDNPAIRKRARDPVSQFTYFEWIRKMNDSESKESIGGKLK